MVTDPEVLRVHVDALHRACLDLLFLGDMLPVDRRVARWRATSAIEAWEQADGEG